LLHGLPPDFQHMGRNGLCGAIRGGIGKGIHEIR
jgi:hypothetical protein